MYEIPLVLFIIGLVLLIKGADWVVRFASRIARTYGIPEFVIGLTLVAFATSLPELAVSLFSAMAGATDIASGTIIGSNIANIGLIIGLSLLFRTIALERLYVKNAVLMFVVTVLVSVFFIDGLIWTEGIALIVLLLYSFRVFGITEEGKIEGFLRYFRPRGGEETYTPHRSSRMRLVIDVFLTFVGAVLLVIGADFVVDATLELGTLFHIPEFFIAVIVIAVGTSLPELATSVTAALKGLKGITIGNIIGSNIFNISILGIVSFIRTVPISETLFIIDTPFLIFITFIFLFFLIRQEKLGRRHGILLLGIYAAFVLLQLLTFV